MRINNIPPVFVQEKQGKNDKTSLNNPDISEVDDNVDIHNTVRTPKSGVELNADTAKKAAAALRDKILSQSAAAVQAQANLSPQDVVRLIA